MAAEEEVRPSLLKGRAQGLLVFKGGGCDADAGLLKAAGEKRFHRVLRAVCETEPEGKAAGPLPPSPVGDAGHHKAEHSRSRENENPSQRISVDAPRPLCSFVLYYTTRRRFCTSGLLFVPEYDKIAAAP